MDPENEGKNSLKSDKMKWESLKENNDSYKETSKLISSGDIKDKCHNASSPLNYSRPNDSIAHLRLNIKVLYGLIVGLSAIFICSGIICTLHIRALRRDLDMISDVIYHVHNGAMGIQEKSPIAELLKQTRFLDQNSTASDKARFWAAVSGELDKRNQDAKGETHPNRGKREKRNANDGAPEEWAWMSSYARVPRDVEEKAVNAMDAYCQEVKTYCNARGPRGLPGGKGDKGDKGEDGTRTFNGRVMRGPAGPKGDRGSPGPEGPQGKMGPSGPRGQDGNQGPRGPHGPKGYHGNIGFPGQPGPAGEKGDKGSAGRTGTPGAMAQKGERGHIGPQGPKGDKGKDGMHGVPGLRGHKGDKGRQGHRGMRGPTGNKGEPGVCETFQCVDMEQPTEATTTTTALTLPPLKKECSVKVIGTPLLLGRRRPPQGTQGSFMLDAAGTRGRRDLGKVWATFGTEGNTISEYADITSFKDSKSAKDINLSGSPFFGTGHKVHDEIFYYHWKGEPKIVRFDLNRGEATTVRVLPDFIDISSTEEREQAFLYSSKASIVDFHLDRNGLWALYIQNSTRKVVAAFLDKTTLDVKATVPLDGLEPRSRGGAFVVCGKLYTIRHHNRLHSHLDSVFDLWQNGKFDTIEIKIKIPYRQNAMLSYNYRVVQILGWDSNKQMDYPLILV